MEKKRITLSEISPEWLESRRMEIKPSSLASYRYYLKRYIEPVLGELLLDELSTRRMERFAAELRQSGRKSKTINQTMTILRMILRYAEMQDYALAEQHTVRNVRVREKPVEVLCPEDLESLEEYLLAGDGGADPLVRGGIILSLYTGLRIGEVCALQWKHIDLERGILSVEKTISRIYREEDAPGSRTVLEITAPKTGHSRRRIPLPGFLREHLKIFQGPPSAYFLTGSEKPMEPRVYSRRFHGICRALDLKDRNYHVLRHTFATRCIEAGFDPKTLSEILGHASVGITLNVYAHPTMQMKLDAMEKLRGFYRPAAEL